MRQSKIILHKRGVILFFDILIDEHINALKLNSLKEIKVHLIVIYTWGDNSYGVMSPKNNTNQHPIQGAIYQL